MNKEIKINHLYKDGIELQSFDFNVTFSTICFNYIVKNIIILIKLIFLILFTVKSFREFISKLIGIFQ